MNWFLYQIFNKLHVVNIKETNLRFSSTITQISIFGTISYKFDFLLHITVQNYAVKHRLRTRKVSRVISVKHVQHSLMMDRKRSEIVGVILIVF